MISNIQTTVLQPTVSEYDLYQGFSNFFLVYHYIKFSNFSVPSIILYLNTKAQNGKTAGINYIMLSAKLHIDKYVVNAIFIFEHFYPSSYIKFSRPHTSKQWLAYQ